MAPIVTTRLTQRGQVVIPRAVREQLGLTKGAGFAVVATENTIVLRRLDEPVAAEFDAVVGALRRQAKAAGIRPTDVEEAVEQARTPA
jgi:AbrB family looped-hinge helix DNA binding protein